jgi:hypothetical protein
MLTNLSDRVDPLKSPESARSARSMATTAGSVSRERHCRYVVTATASSMSYRLVVLVAKVCELRGDWRKTALTVLPLTTLRSELDDSAGCAL